MKLGVGALLLALAVLSVPVAARVRAATDDASYWRIVESIPEDLQLETRETTFEAWKHMFTHAKDSIKIGAFYMDFFNGSHYLDNDGQWGVTLFNDLVEAGKRGVKIEIVVNVPSGGLISPDPILLASMGVAEVRFINWTNVAASGILHTKIIITDDKTVYIGSSNIAWDSLAQVKELGVVFTNTPDVALDALKIWDMYWYLGATNLTTPPAEWPAHYNTQFNITNPMELAFGAERMSLYISTTPAALQTPGRTSDIVAILDAINNADEYVFGEVMDYAPTTFYLNPNVYYPPLDTAFRAAPMNKPGVQVRLLFGLWNQTFCSAYPYLQSLALLTNLTVRGFHVPDLPNVPAQIPFTRVNHAKFLVTDKQAFVTTSNWSGDYFETTGGMSLNMVSETVVADLTDIFLRDWNSPYATDLCLVDCDFNPCSQ